MTVKVNQPKNIQFQYCYFNLPAGGVENYFLAGADYCRRRGIDARVLASQNPLRPAPGKESVGTLDVARHPYFHPPSPLLFFRPRLEPAWLKKYISRSSPDIDLFISRHPAYALAAKKAFPGRPVIFLPPDLRVRRLDRQTGRSLKDKIIYSFYRPQIDRIERQAAETADRLITLSQNLRNQFAEHHRIPLERIEVIPPGVDTDRFHPGPPDTDLLRELDIDSRDPVILTVARLSPEKNLEFLLRALKLLRTEEARLVIVGEGDTREELEQTARDLGLASRVRFAGGRKKTEKFYRLARLFVLPSVEEPFGQVFLEAMASRLPCLSLRNRAGVSLVAGKEIISHGRDGFLVEPDDPDELAKKIDFLLNDEGLREKMGEDGRKKVIEAFSWDTHFDRVFNR